MSVNSMAFIRTVRDLTNREKQALTAEILQVRGLMPLLMKPRNKQRWTVEDKAELGIHMQRLSRISPYLVVLVMPGGFLHAAGACLVARSTPQPQADAGGARGG
jgi:hypothetical protein